MKILIPLLLAVTACQRSGERAATDSARAPDAVVPSRPDSARPTGAIVKSRPDSAPRIDSLVVLVQGATLVAFYPPATQAQVDSSEDLATVFDDFTYHLSTAAESLRAIGVTITERPVGQIRLVESGRSRSFAPMKDSSDFGYLLVSPGRPDRVYYGVMTKSDLIQVSRQYLKPNP